MSKILVFYATTDGHTRKICERLSGTLAAQGHEIALVSTRDLPAPDPGAFDKVVIGASIRYGRHSPAIVDFVERHRRELEARPNAFFSVNLVARKPGKDSPETNPYLQKFLKRIAWRPDHLAVFAGKLDYPRYGFWDRKVIQLIMLITKGPTDPRTVAEYTDWDRVDAFARTLAEM